MSNYHSSEYMNGYKAGEGERLALATANSNMRSDMDYLKSYIEQLVDLINEFTPYLTHNTNCGVTLGKFNSCSCGLDSILSKVYS